MLAATLALVVATTACQPPAQEAAGLSEEDIAVLTAREEQEWPQAILAGDAAAAAAGMHSQDAVRLGPNEPVLRGRANIQAYFEEWFSKFDVTEFTQTVEDVDGRGDLAYVRGSGRIVVTRVDTGEQFADEGKHVAIIRKQSDGSWLTDIAIWNSDLPVPEESANSEM